jgi:CheY-like chemotaxis protein
MGGYLATGQLRQRGCSHLVIYGISANALKEPLEVLKQGVMAEYLTKRLQIKTLGNWL